MPDIVSRQRRLCSLGPSKEVQLSIGLLYNVLSSIGVRSVQLLDGKRCESTASSVASQNVSDTGVILT